MWTPFLLYRVYFPIHQASPTGLSSRTPLLPLTIMFLSQLLPPHHHSSETGKSLQYRVSESYCHLLVRRLSTSDWWRHNTTKPSWSDRLIIVTCTIQMSTVIEVNHRSCSVCMLSIYCGTNFIPVWWLRFIGRTQSQELILQYIIMYNVGRQLAGGSSILLHTLFISLEGSFAVVCAPCLSAQLQPRTLL